jgi:hypothetical protein
MSEIRRRSIEGLRPGDTFTVTVASRSWRCSSSDAESNVSNTHCSRNARARDVLVLRCLHPELGKVGSIVPARPKPAGPCSGRPPCPR